MRPRIALTCGDPAGVGPELIGRWLHENPGKAGGFCPIGPPDWLAGLPVEGQATEGNGETHCPGSPTPAGARAAWSAMELAAAGCREGRFRAVVTGPVGKEQLRSVGYGWPGQTEFFAERWGGEPTMAFAGKRLKVVLATWHEPLASIPERLREHPYLLERAVLQAAKWMCREGHAHPRIAVCGLNPHAGEAGQLGQEEQTYLDPQLDELRKQVPGLSPCLPADTVFFRLLEGEFDVAVALYHDQGLIPVKTLEFHSAVNVTLGLPFTRTSPDHGTAFGIAGKGLARPDSLARAIELAEHLCEIAS